VWIGRGQLVSAVFLPGAQQVSVAWSNGVSLNAVDTGQELWFQATPMNIIAFDVQPQGRAFAVALADKSVMTFDAASGTPRHFQGVAPKNSNASWGDISWSPDGRTLAFQYLGPFHNDPIYLLDVASGHIREVPDSQTAHGVIPELVWSPDGSSILITALGDQFPRFMDILTGRERMRLPQSGQVVSSAPIFLADGKTVASEGPTGTVDLLRFPDGAQVRNLRSGSRLLGHRLGLFPNAGSPLFTDSSGRWIAYRGGYEPCYCESGDIPSQYPLVIWDLARGTVRARLSEAVPPLKERHRLAATFDGDSIVMLYESGEITRWAFTDPWAQETIVSRVPAQLVSPRALVWSADGSRLALLGQDGGVEVYDTTGRLLQRFDPPLTTPALSPDGKMVALFDPDHKTEVIYQVQDSRPIRTLPASPVSMGAAFSPDGGSLAYGASGRAAVLDLPSKRVIPLGSAAVAPVQVTSALTRLIWSPNGEVLATVIENEPPNDTDQGVIVLWKRQADGTFGEVYHTATVQASNVAWTLTAFSPSGRRVALLAMPDGNAGDDGQPALVVYDIQAGRVTQSLSGYRLGTWMNDEDLLAAEAQYDRRLTQIDVVNGQKTIAGSVDAVAYSPGGNFIAQVEWSPNQTDRIVTIREWQSGELAVRVPYGSVELLDYRWSPDGHWFATLGNDGTLKIWPLSINR
jgi:WD40 repeat protein